MPLFATTYRYADDTVASRDATRPAHREYLGELATNGSLALSGPFVGGADGALLVFEAATPDDVQALIDADPFVVEGLVAEITVREWQAVLGRLAQHV